MKTQKTHYKYASKRESKDVACDIRLQVGDDIGWSGEFAETQVQRPPEQHSSPPRVCRCIPTYRQIFGYMVCSQQGRALCNR